MLSSSSSSPPPPPPSQLHLLLPLHGASPPHEEHPIAHDSPTDLSTTPRHGKAQTPQPTSDFSSQIHDPVCQQSPDSSESPHAAENPVLSDGSGVDASLNQGAPSGDLNAEGTSLVPHQETQLEINTSGSRGSYGIGIYSLPFKRLAFGGSGLSDSFNLKNRLFEFIRSSAARRGSSATSPVINQSENVLAELQSVATQNSRHQTLLMSELIVSQPTGDNSKQSMPHDSFDSTNTSSHLASSSSGAVSEHISGEDLSQDFPSKLEVVPRSTLITELKSNLRNIFAEAAKDFNKPMGDDASIVVVFCSLFELALQHGLRRNKFSTAYDGGKSEPSFYDVVENLVVSLPVQSTGEPHHQFLGLEAVRVLHWVKTSVGRLRAWIRLSVNSGLLGAKMRLILEQRELINGFYEDWALLKGDDTVEELLSIAVALDAVKLNLSVAPDLALDHSDFSSCLTLSSTASAPHTSGISSSLGGCSDLIGSQDAPQKCSVDSINFHEGEGLETELEETVSRRLQILISTGMDDHQPLASSQKLVFEKLSEETGSTLATSSWEHGDSYEGNSRHTLGNSPSKTAKVEENALIPDLHDKGQAEMRIEGFVEQNAISLHGQTHELIFDPSFEEPVSSGSNDAFGFSCSQPGFSSQSRVQCIRQFELAKPEVAQEMTGEKWEQKFPPTSALCMAKSDGIKKLERKDSDTEFPSSPSPSEHSQTEGIEKLEYIQQGTDSDFEFAATPVSSEDSQTDVIKRQECLQERVDRGSEFSTLPVPSELYQGNELFFSCDLEDLHTQNFPDRVSCETQSILGISREAFEGSVLLQASSNAPRNLPDVTSEGRDAPPFISEGQLSWSGGVLDTKCNEELPDDSEELLFREVCSDSLCNSDLESIFGEGTDDERHDSPGYPLTRKKSDSSDYYLSSLEVAFGGNDWDEFMQESAGVDFVNDFTSNSDADVAEETNLCHPLEFGTEIPDTGFVVDNAGDATEEYSGSFITEENNLLKDNYDKEEVAGASSEIQKSTNVGGHSLVSLISGCGRPDLEEEDEHVESDEFEGHEKHGGSLSRTGSSVPLEQIATVSDSIIPAHYRGNYSPDESSQIMPDGLPLPATDSRTVFALENFDVEGYQGFINKEEKIQSYDEDSIVNVPDGAGVTSTKIVCDSTVDRKAIIGGPANDADSMEVSEAFISDAAHHEETDNLPLEKSGEAGAAISLSWKGSKQSFQEDEGKVETMVVSSRKDRLKEASSDLNVEDTVNWGQELGPDEVSRYVEMLDVNESYIDTVLDMEDVLLNSDDASGGGFSHSTKNSTMLTARPARDGSLSASISDFNRHSNNLSDIIPVMVDWIEVTGAKQKRGGASFGERIVGVKDYTVYCVKVRSGNREWEIERRYRDFVDLYRQLKVLFNAQTDVHLPAPWEEVDKESRKVFGNTSPNVVEVRSALVQTCLQSLLQAGAPFSTATPLFWFLRPTSAFDNTYLEGNQYLSREISELQKGLNLQLGAFDFHKLQSPQPDTESSKTEHDGDGRGSPFVFGKTIQLIVHIHPNKSLRQLLYAQHFACAGCYKHLDAANGFMQGFVQSLGWGKPRLCEYSGQLFCSSCHLNETAVLPARVLRHWDFTPKRVSQLAKAYLDSIYDQPMLCVSAVNPYLYSRVPLLAHITKTRRRLSSMLSCLRCPSRARIQQTLGQRRYLLENNDFFALRDLEDLSKGLFAVLPGLLKAISDKLTIHITKQCSVCQDVGEWCSAGILCEDPFSPIFPFEDANVTTCVVCHMPFHNLCFQKCSSCPSCNKGLTSHMVANSDADDENNSVNHSEMLTALSASQCATRNTESDLQQSVSGQSLLSRRWLWYKRLH